MGSRVSTLKIFLFLPEQSSTAVLHPSLSLVMRCQDSKHFLTPVHSGRTYIIMLNATSGSITQCGNLHAHWCQTWFTIGRMWVWSSQSPVSLSLISFYTPDIFAHALSGRVRDFSHYTFINEIKQPDFLFHTLMLMKVCWLSVIKSVYTFLSSQFPNHLLVFLIILW